MLGIYPISPVNLLVDHPGPFKKETAELWYLKEQPVVDENEPIGKDLGSRQIKNLNQPRILSKDPSSPRSEIPVSKQLILTQYWEVSKGGDYCFNGPYPYGELDPMRDAISQGRANDVKCLLNDD